MSYKITRPIKLRKKYQRAIKQVAGEHVESGSLRRAAQREWQKLHDSGIIYDSCMAERFAHSFRQAALGYVRDMHAAALRVRRDWGGSMISEHDKAHLANCDIMAYAAGLRFWNRRHNRQ